MMSLLTCTCDCMFLVGVQRQSKVSYLQNTLVKQDVLGLDVPADTDNTPMALTHIKQSSRCTSAHAGFHQCCTAERTSQC